MKSGRQKDRGVLVFLLWDGESAIRNLAGVMRAAKERGWRTQIAPGALRKEDDGLHFALAPTGGSVAELLDSWRPDGCVVIASGLVDEVPLELDGRFPANDAVASDVLKACTRLGLAVPGAVAVIGVDGQKWLCENTDPPLSSIAPDSEGMGVAAVELLAEMMDSPDRIFPLRRFGVTPRQWALRHR